MAEDEATSPKPPQVAEDEATAPESPRMAKSKAKAPNTESKPMAGSMGDPESMTKAMAKPAVTQDPVADAEGVPDPVAECLWSCL